MPPNIRDVAEAAGVSVTTVSHALSGRGRVAAATRDRVLRIAEDVGYTANAHAQRLVSGRSRTLAIQIAGFSSDDSPQLLPDAAFFLDVLNGAAGAAAAREYELVLAPHDLDPRRTQALAIDGAVVVDPHGDEPLLSRLPERGIPVVTTGRPTRGAVRFPWVDNDHAGLTVRMLEHFAEMGYERPAVIATTRSRSYVADIVDAYGRWSRERGLRPITVELAEPPTERAAARAAQRLLTRAKPPDAVYATYDRLALGVLRQAQQLGLSVPGDLGIASAVDGDTLHWVSPHVTAAALNPRMIGRRAIEILIDLAEGNDASPGVMVPGRVMVRASTQRDGAGAGAGAGDGAA
jgi:DNA-binding LacI/PurR family transcriptional regulator